MNKLTGISDRKVRLHNLVYSAVYPAFLGSFIFGLLWQPVSWCWWWGLLLAVYFTLQQIEGTISGPSNYSEDRFFVDVVEIALMVMAFIALGLVKDASTQPISQCLPATLFTSPPCIVLTPNWLLPAVFGWPPLMRLIMFWRWKNNFGKAGTFYACLTAMSTIAAVLSVWHQNGMNFGVVAVLLGAYLAVFQIWNEPIAGEGRFARPSAAKTRDNDLAGQMEQYAKQAELAVENAKEAVRKAEGVRQACETAVSNAREARDAAKGFARKAQASASANARPGGNAGRKGE